MIIATTNPDPPTDEAIIVGHRICGPTQIKAYALHRTQHTRFQVGCAIFAYATEHLPGWNPVLLEESRSTLVSGECMTVIGFEPDEDADDRMDFFDDRATSWVIPEPPIEAGRWARRQPR